MEAQYYEDGKMYPAEVIQVLNNPRVNTERFKVKFLGLHTPHHRVDSNLAFNTK